MNECKYLVGHLSVEGAIQDEERPQTAELSRIQISAIVEHFVFSNFINEKFEWAKLRTQFTRFGTETTFRVLGKNRIFLHNLVNLLFLTTTP